MQVMVANIKSIEDNEGKYGPQKKITFQDDRGTYISGYLDLKNFNPSDWVNGTRLELDLRTNGKFTNFYWPKGEKKAAGGIMEKLQSPEEQIARHTEVMSALRNIYKLLQDIGTRLPPADSSPSPWGGPPPFPRDSGI